MISQRAAARLRQGHVWIYRSDVIENATDQPGSLVSVADQRGNLVGTAFYSASSQIALRMISSGPVDSDQLIPLIGDRLKNAIELRRTLVRDSDAYRLVFSEADQLPGIIADRYNDVVTVQFLTQAVDQEQIRQLVIDTFVGEIGQSRSWNASTSAFVNWSNCHRAKINRSMAKRHQRSSPLTASTSTTTQVEARRPVAFLDQRENYAAGCPLCSRRSARRFHLSRRLRAPSRESVQQHNRR